MIRAISIFSCVCAISIFSWCVRMHLCVFMCVFLCLYVCCVIVCVCVCLCSTS